MGALIQSMILIFMEMLCCNIFVSMFFENKNKLKKWQIVLLWGVTCFIARFSTQIFREYFALKIISSLCILTIVMIAMYKANVVKIFLVCMGGYGTMLACDLAIMVIIENTLIWRWTSNPYEDIYITLISILAKTIEFILFVCLKWKFSKNKEFYQLDKKVWYRFLLSSFLTLIILLILFSDYQGSDITRVIIAFGLMLLNILFYYSMLDIVKSERKSQEFYLIQEKAKGQIALYNNMEKTFLEQRGIAHEFKNHMACIQGLLEEDNVKNALEYIGNIANRTINKDTLTKTGNTIIDIIVSQKYQEARQNNITFVMILDRLDEFPMSEADTTILLSNLLNNAIEACMEIERVEDKIIKLKFIKKENIYFLKITNKSKVPLDIVNQIAITTKSNKEKHGIGMRNIKEIIEKYNADGMCEFIDGWFVYTIAISPTGDFYDKEKTDSNCDTC